MEPLSEVPIYIRDDEKDRIVRLIPDICVYEWKSSCKENVKVIIIYLYIREENKKARQKVKFAILQSFANIIALSLSVAVYNTYIVPRVSSGADSYARLQGGIKKIGWLYTKASGKARKS